jgi:hypothetical protein
MHAVLVLELRATPPGFDVCVYIFIYLKNLRLYAHHSLSLFSIRKGLVRCQWVRPVILATWKTEIGRISVHTSPGK